MQKFEFRSALVETPPGHHEADITGCWVPVDRLEKKCNEWAKEGFVVFSVVCPDPRNFSTYRITAKRDREADWTPNMMEE